MTVVMEAPDAAALEGAVAQVKAYLRIDSNGEDALTEELLRAALAHAEAFTGQVTLTRAGVATMPVAERWTRLPVTPVRSIGALRGIPAEGSVFTLPVGSHAIDIDASGDGWVRVTTPGSAGRVEVPLVAGMAEDWDGLPEGLRQGVVRLAAHMFTDRDGLNAPPAAVTALWRPWRRMRLT
ncbi:head-tail connector protein [Sphingobium phenoxybenzoativorans]|nr:hypothetical protein [Sphingobium phenoxybenzoativorans]